MEGREYYLSDHVFYQKITRNGQDLYVTVDAPVGAKVATIPEYAVEVKYQDWTLPAFWPDFLSETGRWLCRGEKSGRVNRVVQCTRGLLSRQMKVASWENTHFNLKGGHIMKTYTRNTLLLCATYC